MLGCTCRPDGKEHIVKEEDEFDHAIHQDWITDQEQEGAWDGLEEVGIRDDSGQAASDEKTEAACERFHSAYEGRVNGHTTTPTYGCLDSRNCFGIARKNGIAGVLWANLLMIGL